MATEYDVVVIGGGPGGYVAAIRAAQLGLKTAVVEKEALGGVCLNWGCIPSKALLKNAEILGYMKRAGEFGISFDNLHWDMDKAVQRSRQVVTRLVKGVEFLMKKNKIDVFISEGFISAPGTVEVKSTGQKLATKNILIATGGRSRGLKGVAFDGQKVITSREALDFKEAPHSMVIVGGGAIGAELGYFFHMYGTEVTILEMLPHLLPQEDEEISQVLEKEFAKDGIKFKGGATVQNVGVSNGKVTVTTSAAGKTEDIPCDKALIAIGVQGNSDNLGLEALGVQIEKSFIKIDARMATNVPGIYAIGDVTGPPLLAHVASHKGKLAVEGMAGKEVPKVDYDMMPRCTFCLPQVGSMGLTEAEARKRGYEVKVGRFPFRASGKALASAETEGMVKLVTDAKYGDLLGAHMIGGDVTEFLAEVSLAKAMEATPAELGSLVHSHPTMSEALMEAALDVEGRAIHI